MNKWIWIGVAAVVIIVLVIMFASKSSAATTDPNAELAASILTSGGAGKSKGDCNSICKCDKLFSRSGCKKRCKSDLALGKDITKNVSSYCL